MRFTVSPITPTDAVTLPRVLENAAGVRADVGLWLAEVQANRCIVERMCFLLHANWTPVGYLLGLERHGRATCTGLSVSSVAPHAGTWHLVHAFMERLVELRVDSADFCLAPADEPGHTMLAQLGAVDVGVREDRRFGTGTRDVLQLTLASARFQRLRAMGEEFAGQDTPALTGQRATTGPHRLFHA